MGPKRPLTVNVRGLAWMAVPPDSDRMDGDGSEMTGDGSEIAVGGSEMTVGGLRETPRSPGGDRGAGGVSRAPPLPQWNDRRGTPHSGPITGPAEPTRRIVGRTRTHRRRHAGIGGATMSRMCRLPAPSRSNWCGPWPTGRRHCMVSAAQHLQTAAASARGAALWRAASCSSRVLGWIGWARVPTSDAALERSIPDASRSVRTFSCSDTRCRPGRNNRILHNFEWPKTPAPPRLAPRSGPLRDQGAA